MPGFNGTNCENSKHNLYILVRIWKHLKTVFLNIFFAGFFEIHCFFIIADVDECITQPCMNNGTCIDLISDYKCVCLGGFNGTNCTIGKSGNVLFSVEGLIVEKYFVSFCL